MMDPVQKANLVALPIIVSSILRLVLGFMTDYIEPKRTALEILITFSFYISKLV